MEEVSGPVIAIAIILAAVFVPTAFIPGITGKLYQQFAVTIAVSVILSAFNALSLSPALSALLLKPKKKGTGPLQKFYDWFNRMFGRATDGYVSTCGLLIRKSKIILLLLLGVTILAGLLGKSIPTGFLPDEDQGYIYAGVMLPQCRLPAAHRGGHQAGRGDHHQNPRRQVHDFDHWLRMLSQVQNTYSCFFFISLEDWGERKKPEEKYEAIMAHLNAELKKIPGATALLFLRRPFRASAPPEG